MERDAGEALNVRPSSFVIATQSHYELKVLISIFDVQQSLTTAYDRSGFDANITLKKAAIREQELPFIAFIVCCSRQVF